MKEQVSTSNVLERRGFGRKSSLAVQHRIPQDRKEQRVVVKVFLCGKREEGNALINKRKL